MPALARAGVVDAGGRGLVVLLDSLAGVITGVRAELAPPRRSARPRSVLESAREAGSDRYAFEVQYLLDADDSSVAALRTELGRMGDSLVVVGTGEGVWNVHVHVNDVGAALEAGVEAGRPHRITVVRFADQVPTPPVSRRTGVAVVAVAPGEGLAHLFAGEGVHVVGGGPGDNPAMAEAAAATRWAEVTVAQREALTSIGRVEAGDVLGLIDGEVVEIGTSVRDVAIATLDRLLGVGGELITILAGRDADPSLAPDLRAHLAEAAPLTAVAAFDGGQPHYPLLLGVE